MKQTRRMVRWAGLCLAALAVASLTACRTRSRATSGIEGTLGMSDDEGGDVLTAKYVVVNNPQVARGVQIVDLRMARTPNGLCKAVVTLVSKYSKTLPLQYQFAWYDSQGMEIDPGSRPWEPLVLYGNETKTVQSTAPTASAAEFKVKLRAH